MARTIKSNLGFVESPNFQGSSGYWAGTGSGASGSGTGSVSFPNLGYPGDAALGRIKSTTTAVSPTGGTASLYQPLQITKSAALASGANDLMAAFKSGADSIPGYSDLLNQAKTISGNFKNAYNRTNQALDLTGYAAGQRGADAGAAAMTRGYGAQANDILSRYAGNDERYAGELRDITGRAYGMLPEFDTAARNIGDEQIARMLGQVSRYKIAGGNLGVGGDELRKIARGVANVELPLEQQRIQRMYDVLTGVELPSQREIANREATRLTNVELPTQRDLYGLNQNDILRSKQTEQHLKQLEMTTAGMSMQAARDYLQSLALPVELIQQILQRKNQTLAGQIANLSGIGNIEDQAYYRGLEYTPGANLTHPVQYNMTLPPLPSSFPSRFSGGGVNPVNPAQNRFDSEVNRLRELRARGALPATPAPRFDTSGWNGGTGFTEVTDPATGRTNVSPLGAMAGYQWSASDPNARSAAEQAYFEAVQRQYQ